MKILLADDHALFREAMHYHLAQLRAEVSILDASCYQEALELAKHNPDIGLVLLDLDMPDGKGEASVEEFCLGFPGVPVVVISGVEQRSSIERVLNYGAMGFISKISPSSEMLNALNLVLDGGIYLPPLLLKQALGAEAPVRRDGAGSMTPRQLQVLKHMSEGLSNKEIGQALGLAEGTIKIHVAAIFQALGVAKRVDAVVKAKRLNLVPDPG